MRLSKSKCGKPLYLFTLEELRAADDNMSGYCIRCGTERDGCEPDARKYPCENCGEPAVYGGEELMLMGLCDTKAATAE